MKAIETVTIDSVDKFEKVKHSREYAERYSAVRHARLPKHHSAMWMVNRLAYVGIGCFGILMSLVGLSGIFGGSTFFGLAFLVPSLIAIFGACMSWWVLGKQQETLEKTPVVAESAVVVDKRKVVRQTEYYSERRSGTPRAIITIHVEWYATFEDEQGESQEYELFALNNSHGVREPEPEFPFYDKLTAGDAGVLYARDTVAFDFDKVC